MTSLKNIKVIRRERCIVEIFVPIKLNIINSDGEKKEFIINKGQREADIETANAYSHGFLSKVFGKSILTREESYLKIIPDEIDYIVSKESYANIKYIEPVPLSEEGELFKIIFKSGEIRVVNEED